MQQPVPPPPPEIASFSYGKQTRRDPNDLCEPVEENLARAAKAIVAGSSAAPIPHRAWDPSKPPKYMDIVDRRYSLTSVEKAMLKKNGFVVPARLSEPGYAYALHDVYQSQLPVFISADAVLHAIYKGNDSVFVEAELALLEPLERALGKMHAAIERGGYPSEVALDLDLYLTVARQLLAGDATEIEPRFKSTDPKPFVERAEAGNGGLVNTTMFGRARMIDWSQYTPRGHYAGNFDLERWFRAVTWLSRLELNLVSRASRSSQPGLVPNPEETPREAVDALALADTAERAGVLADLDRIELLWSELAGKREDVSLRSLLALKKQANITTFAIPDAADKVKAAIGGNFQRTTRMHYMPQGSLPLPAIATMIGPRAVPDAAVSTYLVHATVSGRAMPSFADLLFMLGNDRAKPWLANDLAAFPALQANLDRGRGELGAIPPADVYGAWLGAVRAISAPNEGEKPSFMKTAAYEDMKVNTTVAAYGQLRHNYVLVAGQPYDEGGCEIPDGYVEPALALYESLVTYAQRGGAAMKAIGASKESVEYFARLEKTLGVLVAIVKDELAGRPLSEEEKRWLSMTTEIVPPSSLGPGSYDGWYFDLFRDLHDAFSEHAFVADWFTSSNASAVVYAGAKEPRLGLFVVDAGGPPRVMVGPVARAFEHVGSLDGRLTDKDASKVGAMREPWAASYTAPAPPPPPLQIVNLWDGGETERRYAVRSTRALSGVTLELLGHHREKLAAQTANVGTAWSVVTMKVKADEWAEVLRVRHGESVQMIQNRFGTITESYGGMPDLTYEEADTVRQKLDNSATK
ncbi:MAG: DUF3160 domain-containing protein [Labilithrix sp.]|nr:DUF3160 domain-containing protein [Labilithrix sp.]MCW5816163.1 DUF3160 domain-containing protein [Labilithrix sp.]